MFRHVLFDLDGTLTDSKEGIIKSVRSAETGGIHRRTAGPAYCRRSAHDDDIHPGVWVF